MKNKRIWRKGDKVLYIGPLPRTFKPAPGNTTGIISSLIYGRRIRATIDCGRVSFTTYDLDKDLVLLE